MQKSEKNKKIFWYRKLDAVFVVLPKKLTIKRGRGEREEGRENERDSNREI